LNQRSGDKKGISHDEKALDLWYEEEKAKLVGGFGLGKPS
jgi:hypothetical protein